MAATDESSSILEPYRQYLTVLASVHLAPELRRKLDSADIVQQTMLRAWAALPELQTTEPAALSAWLRKILASVLLDSLKHFHRDKRDVNKERFLEAELDRSSSGMADWLAANQTSPSLRAAQNEQLLRLADALSQLPETMREVVVLKHCQGWTLQQIADRLDRSVPSVASFLRRGLEQLRQHLQAGESQDEI